VFGDYDFTLTSEEKTEEKSSNIQLVPAGSSKRGIQGFLNRKGQQLEEVLTQEEE
jgi:hypothetical protein